MSAAEEPRYLVEARLRATAARQAFDALSERALDGSVTGAEYAEAKAEIEAAKLGLTGAETRWDVEQRRTQQARIDAAVARLDGPEITEARSAVQEAWHELQAPLLAYLDASVAINETGRAIGDEVRSAFSSVLAPGQSLTVDAAPGLERLQRLPERTAAQARTVALRAVVHWLVTRARNAGHDPAYRGHWVEGQGFRAPWESESFTQGYGISFDGDEQ